MCMKAVLVITLLSVVLVSALTPGQAPDNFVVSFTLQGGQQPAVVVRFNITRSWAPLGVDHFYQLLTLPNGSYYEQNGFFRVVLRG
jgi:hypothetical protein